MIRSSNMISSSSSVASRNLLRIRNNYRTSRLSTRSITLFHSISGGSPEKRIATSSLSSPASVRTLSIQSQPQQGFGSHHHYCYKNHALDTKPSFVANRRWMSSAATTEETTTTATP
jgi:hypothetical protein